VRGVLIGRTRGEKGKVQPSTSTIRHCFSSDHPPAGDEDEAEKIRDEEEASAPPPCWDILLGW
jgi:hypothetical protein